MSRFTGTGEVHFAVFVLILLVMVATLIVGPKVSNTTQPTLDTYIEEMCIDKVDTIGAQEDMSTLIQESVRIKGNLFKLPCGHFSYIDYNAGGVLIEIDPKAIDYYGLERFY